MANSLEQGFLHAITTDPDDDIHRLVYADWLEENDQQPRGEFIQLQCQIARMQPTDPALPALQASANTILQEYQEEFLGILPRVADIVYQFRRGFVEVVQLPMSHSKHHLPRIFQHAPLLQELEFHNPYLEESSHDQPYNNDARAEAEKGERSLADIFGMTQSLPRIRRLHIEGYGQKALLNNLKCIKKLQKLEFASNHSVLDDVIKLAQVKKNVLSELKTLSFQREWIHGGLGIDCELFANYLGCTAFPALALFDLSNNSRLSDEFANLLEQSPLFTQIRIDVSHTLATPERVQRLLEPRG